MKAIISFLVTIVLVVALSYAFSGIIFAGEKKETSLKELTVSSEMTVRDFISANSLERPFAKQLLGLSSPADLDKSLNEFGTPEQINKKYLSMTALKTEEQSKNWIKIPLKFALWAAFLIYMFVVLKKGGVTAAKRKWLYALSFAVFGVILGSDPGPMGTVKDAVYLYGKAGVIFPPRLVAMSVFLLTVFLANKFICSWGCQSGTLQDFIFRLGRNGKDTGSGSVKQFRMPFAFTNSVRALVFIAMFVTAFAYAYDLFSAIDPFRIFKPAALGVSGAVFVGGVMLLSLFTYRPWCLLFCPFGFLGWIVEKASLYRIKVNYDSCIACGKCSESCPSTVMDAILKQDRKTIPDCFSCGVCVETCPTGSVSFARGRSANVPEGKF